MKKNAKYIIIALVTVVVILAILIAVLLSRNTNGDITVPDNGGISTTDPNGPGNNGNGNNQSPYADYEKQIIGTWVVEYENVTDKQLEQLPNVKFVISSDGTITQYLWNDIDADYPENWKVNVYNYYFDIYRDETVVYTNGALGLKGYPQRFEFFTDDQGRQVATFQNIYEDGTIGSKTKIIKEET